MSIKLITGLSIDVIPRRTTTVLGATTIVSPAQPVLQTPLNVPTRQPAPLPSPLTTEINPVFGKIQSQHSVNAPISTLFDKFDLKTEPVYNFFVEDETTNETATVGKRKLDEIPRYVHLSWRPAPKMLVQKFETGTKTVRVIPATAVPVIVHAGTTYVPQPIMIEQAANVAANGYVAPGAIRANVEMPTQIVQATPVNEHTFLASSVGTSLKMFSSNVRAVQKPQVGAAAALPFVAATPTRLTQQATAVSQLMSLATTVSLPIVQTTPVRRVTFVDPTVTGIISETSVATMSRPEHAEVVTALAPVLPVLVAQAPLLPILRTGTEPPALPSAVQQGTAYMGYVIEKYKQQADGTFTLLSTFHIDDISQTELIDAAVVYTGVYRYRMRTTLRWTHDRDTSPFPVLLQTPTLHPAAPVAPLARSVATFFDGDWSRSWGYAAIVDNQPPPPPDEITVRQSSSTNRVFVSWKMPENSQLDISGFQVYRKTADIDMKPLSEWAAVGPVYSARNGQFIDVDVAPVEKNGGVSYVYAVVTLTVHGERSLLSDQVLVWLTTDADELGEPDRVFFSEAGVDFAMHGPYAVKPVREERVETTVRDIFSLVGRVSSSKQQLDEKQYVVRVLSLDTGETRDIDLELLYTNVARRTVNSPVA